MVKPCFVKTAINTCNSLGITLKYLHTFLSSVSPMPVPSRSDFFALFEKNLPAGKAYINNT